MEEKQFFTQKELLQKYGWKSKSIADLVKYANFRGVQLRRCLELGLKPYKYEILDDTITKLEWRVYPRDNYFEVAKEGYIRTSQDKRLVGAVVKSNGYMSVMNPKNNQTYRIHRMILETYEPVENMNSLVVDHIDGNREHNHIENLRWVTDTENQQYKQENRIIIDKIVYTFIQRLGYKKTTQILEELARQYNF